MRIGILTLFYGFNEGAILQAYAMTRFLGSLFPEAEVEIVDHRDPSLAVRVYGRATNPRQRALEEFVENRLPRSSFRNATGDRERTFRHVAERYDAVVVGSDEVWKVNYGRMFGVWPVQRDPWAPAFPNAFWPDHPSLAIASYAASVGSKTNWFKIPASARRKMRDVLQRFVLLAIRDQKTLAFLKFLDTDLAAKASIVPDPTFTLPPSELRGDDQFKARLSSHGWDFQRKRVGVVLRDRPEVSGLLQKLHAGGVQLISFSEANRACEVRMDQEPMDPLDWARALSCVDLVISERMHPCIFGLLHERPVIAVDYRGQTLPFPTKLEELFKGLGLTSYIRAKHEPALSERALELANAALEEQVTTNGLRSGLEDARRRAADWGTAFRTALAG